ncbi:MAG: DUF4159 domain-containing protein [bacterium]
MKLMYKISFMLFTFQALYACDLTITRLKYHGGGDWYSNPTSLQNLIQAAKSRTKINVCGEEKYTEIISDELHNSPFLYMTGHGRVVFSDYEAERLKTFFEAGGFLWADDNYGMDKYFRKEILKIFPGAELKELPFSHPIYHSYYDFNKGLPKIHEHDGGPPKGYGLFHEGRMVVFYSFNTDIGDGMEDLEVHKDSPEKHEQALRMGINILVWFLTHI